MTGRQLLRRPGYEVDIEEILAACATRGVAVEINPNPWRLDLDWRWHERELERGCMMSINPDAHSTDQIDHTTGEWSWRARVRRSKGTKSLIVRDGKCEWARVNARRRNSSLP